VPQPQGVRGQDCRRRLRLALPRQDIEDDVGRVDTAGERLGAGTATRPSLSTADNTLTIWRSPSSEPFSLRRTRSRLAGNSQSLNGAPFLSAPGLRGEHRHIMPGVVNRLAAAEMAAMLADDRAVLADHHAIGVGLDLDWPPYGT
jgi:hypothetical protein